MENEGYETIDLLEVLNAVRQHLLAVILATVILAAAGFGISKFLITPQYEASALMIVNTRQDTTSNVTSDQINSATKLVSTYSIIIKSDTVLQQVIARLLAVGLPDSLIGARGMLLKVKVDESGYELVHTAALPRFYGFALSSDGSELLLTEGRDANFNAQDFLAWTLAEGVTFALHQNALEVQL